MSHQLISATLAAYAEAIESIPDGTLLEDAPRFVREQVAMRLPLADKGAADFGNAIMHALVRSKGHVPR